MIHLLGIDDTDSATSRGTGYQARWLGEAFQDSGLAKLLAVTRHQLLVDSRIDYTSRNSSVCVVLEAQPDEITNVADFSISKLRSRCAPKSNAGIAIATPSAIDNTIQGFGRAAKQKILTAKDAQVLAQSKYIQMNHVTGSGIGIIGALAAIGLHASGDDGRYIWLPKLRELNGIHTVADLINLLGAEVRTTSGEALPSAAEIETTDWMRPVMQEGRAILLAEQEIVDGEIGWRIVDKSTVKAFSD